MLLGMERRKNIASKKSEAVPTASPANTDTVATAASVAARTHRDRTLLITAIALFAAFSTLRICLATFSKSIDVSPDELRYLDLARSLFNGGSLVIRGDASDFQKILYPLSLFPALLFNDTVAQVKAIGVLNSLYICSAVFPAYLLAQRLFDNKSLIVICMIATLAMPDMCYSMGFMSESVYFPLALWLILLLWCALNSTGKRRYALSTAGGVLCYACYLGKEIAAAFVIAFVLLYAIMAIRKTEDRHACILAIIGFLIGFGVPFLIMKATLFNGLHNSYNQMSPSVLEDPYTLLFTLYALGNYTTHAIVAFAFFPLFFVAATYRDLSKDEKRLFLLCIIALIVGLLVVVYTICIREDVGCIALRQHLRYVTPLFMPLLFLFIKQIGHADTTALKHDPRRLTALATATTAVIVLVATLFGSANLQQGFDNSQFHVFRWFYGLFGNLDASWITATSTLVGGAADNSTLLPINPGIWLSRLLVIAFIGGGTIGLLGKHRTKTGVVLIAVVIAMMIANNVVNYQYDMTIYACDETMAEETSAIDEYLSQLPDDARVLIVNNTKRTETDNLADTYIDDRRLIYRYTTSDDLATFAASGALHGRTALTSDMQPLSDQTVADDVSFPGIDYILVNADQRIAFTSNNVQAIDVDNSAGFQLYRITNDQPITLIRN